MTTGSILLGLALLMIVALFLLRPLLAPPEFPRRRAGNELDRPLSPRQALQAQKDHLLEEIRALDFDQDTGKLPPDVYEAQRASLVAAAAEILKELDQLAPDELGRGAIEAEIEAAIASRRRSLPQAAPAAARVADNGRPKAEPVAAVPAGATTVGRFCPNCGQASDAGDKFCAYCGHRLK